MIKVLVCGGRDYTNRENVFSLLNDFILPHIKIHVIEGGAKGADRLAREWAIENGMSYTTYEADWKKHGKAAGPIRNQEMLDRESPDWVIAFPGGKGTANMIKLAKKHGVKCVYKVDDNGRTYKVD